MSLAPLLLSYQILVAFLLPCGIKKHERLHEYFKTQLLLEVQRSELVSKAIQLQKKRFYFFPTSLHNVLSPSPSPSRLVSFFSFFSLHA